jgi:hypothetical protein
MGFWKFEDKLSVTEIICGATIEKKEKVFIEATLKVIVNHYHYFDRQCTVLH